MTPALRGPLRDSALCAFICFLVAAAPLAAQSLAGDWIFTVESDGGGAVDVLFSFDESGDEVRGSVDLSGIPQIEASEISDVTYQDGVLSFLLRIAPVGGAWITLEVVAEVDGDEMEGEAHVAELGQAQPFTARRRASGAASPP